MLDHNSSIIDLKISQPEGDNYDKNRNGVWMAGNSDLSWNGGFKHESCFRRRNNINNEVGELPTPINLVFEHLAVDSASTMRPVYKKADLDPKFLMIVSMVF